MRLALVSLIALAVGASAYAQPAATPTEPQPAAPPAAGPAPAAPTAATPAGPTTASPPSTAAPGAPGASNAAAPAAPAAAPTPPPPPPPPTDPTAIAVLDVLQNICIPAASGGNLPQLAKANGYRKNGDNWVYRQKTYSLTVEDPGSNPNQCHVEISHPVDLQAPGRPIIVALNDWAAVEHGWSLYRNDKSVQGDAEFTTRSWQLDWNGTEQSLVFTTQRKPDGAPLHANADSSELIYGVVKTAS